MAIIKDAENTGRLHYLDIAKGLLIIMVVYGHFELLCRVCYHIEDHTVVAFDKLEKMWVVFFMPAFFFITGYCSNFRKPFLKFVSNGFMILLLPALIINLSINLFDYISWGEAPIWIVKTMTKSVLLQAAGEWFIPSLFIARIIIWFLQKMDNVIVRLAIALVLFGCGIVLYNSFHQIPNVWFFKHAFMVTVFVLLGNLLRDRGIQLVGRHVVAIVYMVVIICMMATRIHIPFISNKINVSYQEIPILLLLAMMGIITILEVSKLINRSKVLEYLGKNSLVIYLIHFMFYRIYIYLALPYFGQNAFLSALLFITIVVVNIVSCCACAWLLNTRYFKWILGR